MPLANIIVYGLEDALNPCNLSTLVIFFALLSWLRRRKIPVVSLIWLFVTMSYTAVMLYSFGIGMDVLYSVPFFNSMRVFYVIIGVILVVTGLVHLLDWFKIRSGKVADVWLPFLDDGSGKPCSPLMGRILVFCFAFFFNATATVWPGNKFISFFANYLYVPGEFLPTALMLTVYSVMIVVPFVLGLFWISWTSPGGLIARKMSMAKIVSSAFVIGLGVSLLYVFH